MPHKIIWIPVTNRLPPDGKFVMVTGASGWTGTPNFLALAKLDSKHRPPIEGRLRWLGAASEDLNDNGWEPTHWAEPIPLPAL